MSSHIGLVRLSSINDTGIKKDQEVKQYIKSKGHSIDGYLYTYIPLVVKNKIAKIFISMLNELSKGDCLYITSYDVLSKDKHEVELLKKAIKLKGIQLFCLEDDKLSQTA